MNATLMAAASLAFLAAQDMVVDGDQVLIPPRLVDTFHIRLQVRIHSAVSIG
ncbi:MAG TPA: hypothetical protein VGC82_08480 [Rhodopila sp.]